MSNRSVTEIFDKTPPEAYDERNRKLAPISDNLLFLIQLVLDNLPQDAKILCVGVGTGTEVISLARAFPNWTFTGLDPSANMLAGCRKRLETEGLLDRCTLVQGYLADLPDGERFDAALCLLVAHFIQDAGEREGTFAGMAGRLKPGGFLVNAEISFDPLSSEFPDLFEKWKTMQIFSGGSPESVENLLDAMREHLAVLPPESTKQILKIAGFALPIQFFQSFLIRAWYARKP